MNEVIERIRAKYPEYNEVSDDDLTWRVAQKYPQYLSNESFSQDLQRIGKETFAAPSDEERVALINQIASESVPGVEGEPAIPSFLTEPLLKVIPQFSTRDIANASRAFMGAAVSTPLQQVDLGQTQATDEQLKSSKGLQVVTGAANASGDLINFFTSPIGIATLGMGSLPAGLQRLVAGGFALDMASATPEIATELGAELGKPEAERDYEKISNLVTSAATTLGFTSMAGKHALAPSKAVAKPLEVKADEIAPVAPLTAEALRGATKTKTSPVQVELVGEEPPVLEGYTRLYRGETPPRPILPESDAARIDKATFEPPEFRGRWWTQRKSVAERFSQYQNIKGKLFYVDIPTLDLDLYRASNIPEAKAHSLSPGSEFIFPRIEKPARPIAQVAKETPVETLAKETATTGEINETKIRPQDEAQTRQETVQDADVKNDVSENASATDRVTAVQSEWRKSFDEAPDIETKIDWLRAVANNRGRKSTSAELTDVLIQTEQLLGQQKHSRLANVLWDISKNPEALPETRSRAQTLYEEFWKPSEPTTLPEGAGKTTPLVGEQPPPVAATPTVKKAVAKVEKQVKQVAATEGQRPAKEVKTELVARIQSEINAVVKDAAVTTKKSEYAEDRYDILDKDGKYIGWAKVETLPNGKVEASFKSNWERKTQSLKADSLEDALSKVAAIHSNSEGKVTFEIPGDGSFTVYRSGRLLHDLIKRAERINTESFGAKKPGQTNYKEGESAGRTNIQKMRDENASIEGAADTAQKLYGGASKAADIVRKQIEIQKSNQVDEGSIAMYERVLSVLEERIPKEQEISAISQKPIIAMKRKEMIDELHSYGETETRTGGYVKNLNVSELRELLYDARLKQKSAQPIGMGGAVPSEFEVSPKTPTSIKNAQVDVERQQRGLPPAVQPARRSFGKVWDEAMAKIDNDPGYPDRLFDELREQPRALTDLEDAIVLQRQIDLQNEYGKATRDLAQAYDDKRVDDVRTEQARVAAVSDQLLDIYNIGKKSGTATGRGLNARKMMAFEDFTLAKMELEKRAAKGGEQLTPEERSEVTRLQKQIEDTQKAYDDYVTKTDAKLAELEVKKALDQIEKDAAKGPDVDPKVKSLAERIVLSLEEQAEAARARLKSKFARTSAGVDPTILSDLAIIGASHIGRGTLEFSRWSAKMLEEFGDAVKPYLKQAFDASNALLDDKIEKMAGPRKERVKRAVRASDDIDTRITDTEAKIKDSITKGDRNEITPLVQQLARLFVTKGIVERNALIDAVHDVLKRIDPEITRRETMDAISGYGDFRQLTKDEISVKLRDLKGQMQQVAKLEDMQAGRPPLKTGVERRVPSTEESRLIRLVNEAKNQFQIPITDEATQLKSSLDTLKARLKSKTAEWEDRLKRGDFAKKPRRIVQMDAEAQRLHYENAKMKVKWHEALMKDRLARRSLPQKIFGTAVEAVNTIRAVMTSLDLSAVLRQGGFIALGSPVRALKSFPAMFKAFKSEANQHAINQEIAARKNFPLYNQSKLYLSEHGQKLSQMEEAYMSRWADKIPLVAGSQRAYVTFLNKLRADSFDAMANSLAREKELTPAEANAIANFINVATGRGNLGMKENALVGLNTAFFAPRYVASRFQLLVGQPLFRGTARTRALIAAEYARYLIGIAIVYALAKLSGAEIEDDPRSSDFGKLRYGKTRLDPLSGLQQVTVLTSRLGTGETKNLKGEIIPIRGEKVPFGTDNSADVIARFLRSKLAPVPGAVVNTLAGTDVVGQPVTPESTAISLTTPLAMRDIYSTMREQGVERGTALGILSLFGMGLQTYDDKRNGTNTSAPEPAEPMR